MNSSAEHRTEIADISAARRTVTFLVVGCLGVSVPTLVAIVLMRNDRFRLRIPAAADRLGRLRGRLAALRTAALIANRPVEGQLAFDGELAACWANS